MTTSQQDDPRTEGLGLALRPPVRAASVAPPPRRPVPQSTENDPPPTPPAPVTVTDAPALVSDREQAPPPVVDADPSITAEVDPDAEPRVGSRRGGSIQVATSIPYPVADALAEKAAFEDVTIGSVVADAVRAYGATVTSEVPPKPRRTGKTTVRQFLISPADAEQLARYLDRVPATERMTVSLLLRHCLTRYLSREGIEDRGVGER